MRITPMTTEHSAAISLWKYEGAYSFYDHSAEHMDGFLDGAHYACVEDSGELIGFYCFGEDARIPTVESGVYDDGFLDVGLGLRPELCGRGYGLSFVNACLGFAAETLSASRFRLSVAAFNERAVKVYQKAGFAVAQEVTNSHFKNTFYIMKRDN